MKTLAILSRKGGTGKTTLATHLSVAAENAGHTTALIDLDPQSSAAKWRDNRDGDTPAVISTHSERLSQILQLAEENGATFAILDTAPHTETAALDAARAADVVKCIRLESDVHKLFPAAICPIYQSFLKASGCC